MKLRSYGYKKISIVCHSMGSVLVMESLQYSFPGIVDKIIIHGGDAKLCNFYKNARYSASSKKVTKILSLYSQSDSVLGFARFVPAFWYECVGWKRFEKETPPNVGCVDAELIHGAPVTHGTFKNSTPILRLSGNVTIGKQ